MLILQQNRNTALSIKRQAAQSHAKPVDTPELTTRHFIALQREEIQLHTAEHRHKFPQPGNLDKLLLHPHPQEQTPQLRAPMNFQPEERAPQTQQSKQNEKAEKYSASEGTLLKTHQSKQKRRR